MSTLILIVLLQLTSPWDWFRHRPYDPPRPYRNEVLVMPAPRQRPVENQEPTLADPRIRSFADWEAAGRPKKPMAVYNDWRPY